MAHIIELQIMVILHSFKIGIPNLRLNLIMRKALNKFLTYNQIIGRILCKAHLALLKNRIWIKIENDLQFKQHHFHLQDKLKDFNLNQYQILLQRNLQESVNLLLNISKSHYLHKSAAFVNLKINRQLAKKPQMLRFFNLGARNVVYQVKKDAKHLNRHLKKTKERVSILIMATLQYKFLEIMHSLLVELVLKCYVVDLSLVRRFQY